jgi:hypothetical protein
MSSEKSKQEKKAALIEGMVRRSQWKMSYKTVDDTVSKLPNREKKHAEKMLDEMVKNGLAEYHKNGKCISLKSSKKKEIKAFLEKHSDMQNWMLDQLF